MNADQTRTSALTTWVRAVRPFAFTGVLVPVLLGAAMAAGGDGPVRWGLLPLVVLGTLLFHAGTNLVSDAGDYVRGIDREGKLGGSGVLVAGLLTTRQVFFAGVGAFAAGSVLGMILAWVCGPVVLALGLIGLIGGALYGGERFGYKYLGLGDLAVFVLMGPLTAVGSYYVLTGTFAGEVVLASIPVACLVAAILSGNNYRDAESDAAANSRTMATLLGVKGARVHYCLLVGSAYLVVVGAVVAGLLTPWSLLVLITAPLSAKTTATVLKTEPGAAELAPIDVNTAKLHFAFGLILCAAILVTRLV